MGIIRNGILGEFSNKTGNLVGASWRKLNVIRSLPVKRNKSPSVAQLNQRQKFAMIISFLSPIAALIKMGYHQQENVASAMNVAVSINLANSINGIAPHFNIDLTKISFSAGKLELPDFIAIDAIIGHSIVFSWGYNGNERRLMSPADLVTLLVYNASKKVFAYQINAAGRSERFYTLKLPEAFIGDRVHCYLSFNAMKSKGQVSNSIYAGQAIVF
ncbi:hypothetical protein AAKU52_001604 [Pedobacter sp. CG_S7]|uniref:DUF6266 family protein n=1 Tax=Pedobacter sp. CG_S7 TaxID=3143930 RepID=UPI003392160B